jgi:hypothetical protein
MSWFEFRARPGPRARGLHPLRVDDALTEEDLTDHSHGRNSKRSGWAGKGHCDQINSPRAVRDDRWHARCSLWAWAERTGTATLAVSRWADQTYIPNQTQRTRIAFSGRTRRCASQSELDVLPDCDFAACVKFQRKGTDRHRNSCCGYAVSVVSGQQHAFRRCWFARVG